jgi:hypothetical protein
MKESCQVESGVLLMEIEFPLLEFLLRQSLFRLRKPNYAPTI